MNSCIEELIEIFNNGIIKQYHLIKALINHKQEIINAYQQGYREGQENSNLGTINKDISQFSNDNDYYINTFTKKFFEKI